MASTLSTLRQSVHDGLVASLASVPGLLGQLVGLVVGLFQGSLLLTEFAVQDASKLRSKEGRREVVYGRHPDQRSPRGHKSNGGFALPSILEGKSDGITEKAKPGSAKASGPIHTPSPDAVSTQSSESKAQELQELWKESLSAFSPPSSPPSGAFSRSKPTLTEAAASNQKKALDVFIPPRAMRPKADEKLGPSAIDGELQKPLDLPEHSIPVPRSTASNPPAHINASQSASTHQERELTPAALNVAIAPVIYESSSSESPTKVSEDPKSLAAANDKNLITPEISGHAVEFTSGESTPVESARVTPTSPVFTKVWQNAHEEPSQIKVPRSVRSSESVPDSPGSLASSSLSVPASPDVHANGPGKKQKRKGVKGAFRKIKKALSNK